MNQTLQELTDIRGMIETEVFQKYIVKPLREYQNRLKDAYDCKTLTELATIKGKKMGSEEFFNIMRRIDADYKNALFDAKNNG